MRPLRYATLLGGLALVFMGVSVGASPGQKESQPPSPSGPSVSTPTRDSFAGVWRYNPRDSMNAVNGRTEDAAGATHRTGAADPKGPVPSGLGPLTTNGTGQPVMGSLGQTNAPSPFASLIINEKRDLVRDLLEVPVELTIKLADGSITFVDHLDRELTYPTTGKKQKYQLSASIFEARTYWDGPQLKKDIEATEGFKMRETYFLSEDGKRLFVIVRVGDPKGKDPDNLIVGVNRVYDRTER